MGLKVISLTRYEGPNYPTHGILDEQPELLMLVPRRWKANPAVVTALAGTCLLASPLSLRAAEPAGSSATGRGHTHGSRQLAGLERLSTLILGIPARQPQTLSMIPEAAARQIIADEAKKFGISFAPTVKTLPELEIRVIDLKGKTTSQELNLELDGTDQKRDISFEYVSVTDFRSWRLRPVSYDLKESDYQDTVELLKESLAKTKSKGIFAVFSDPGFRARQEGPKSKPIEHSTPVVTNTRKETATSKPEELLREQVRDFIKWLKAQGVI